MFIFLNKKQNLIKEIEQKDTYVASIVHDMKNPLIAQCRILEKIIRKTENSFVKENCEQILISSRLLLEMIFSVLDTYKYEKGKITYNFENINLLTHTEEIVSNLAYLTDEKDLIKINAYSEAIVKADKLHIRRVISNLISNAIKYKKENTTIVIDIIQKDENINFCVTNQGSYIKPEIQKELFQKYICTNYRFNSHSTGLGLYLSKQIIKAHHGKMYIKSSIEGKNCFGFIIPASKNPPFLSLK